MEMFSGTVYKTVAQPRRKERAGWLVLQASVLFSLNIGQLTDAWARALAACTQRAFRNPRKGLIT